jgi:RNA polymerase sigma-70 factor, ECF subfamily
MFACSLSDCKDRQRSAGRSVLESVHMSELWPAFVAALSGRPQAPEAPGLEALLSQRIAEAEGAWPKVEVPRLTFVRYLAERLPPTGELAQALKDAHAADLYLACGCTLGDPRALQAFEESFLTSSSFARGLGRIDSSPSFVDEVRQLLRIHFLVPPEGEAPKLADYRGRGELAGWVRASAIRTALNLRRGQKHAVSGADLILATAHPEMGYLKDLHGGSLKQAVRDALGSLSPRERNLLRLHYLDGLATPEIAGLFRSHRTTVRRQLNECHEKLKRGVSRFLRDRLDLNPSDARSLERLAESLDLNLSAILVDLEGSS